MPIGPARSAKHSSDRSFSVGVPTFFQIFPKNHCRRIHCPSVEELVDQQGCLFTPDPGSLMVAVLEFLMPIGRSPWAHLSENGNIGGQRETEELQAHMLDWDVCRVHGNDHVALGCRSRCPNQPEWTRSIGRGPEWTNKIGCWRQSSDMQSQLRSMH
jgi:hypothetical protein